MLSRVCGAALVAVVALLSRSNASMHTHKGLFDCMTGPCVTVPGVGKLQGTKKSTQFTGREIFGFWSIPYGEDTSGENRFQPPKPRPPLNDGNSVYDASYLSYITHWFNRVCPQPGLPSGDNFVNPYLAMMDKMHPINHTERGVLDILGSEDCLQLAVYTPELPTEDSHVAMPVIVYIHGGAFMLGGYIGQGPGKLLEKDIVLVEIQYRLGPLGFMCLEDDDIAGNMAMLDQVLALKWVNQHITAFGGDPNQVTIMGESAGSASVTYLMLSPLATPYFQQVIAESGSALSSWAFDITPEKHAKEIASFLDCPMDSTRSLISCLKQDKTAKEIVLSHKKYVHSERAQGRLGFGGSSPCAQTHGKQKFITQHPKDIIMDHIKHGNPSPKRLMTGANKHEGSFVLGLMYGLYFVPNHYLNDTFFLEYEFIDTLLKAMGLNDESGNIYEMLEYSFFRHKDMGTWSTMMEGMVNMVGTFFIKASTYEFMKYNELTGSESWFYSFEYEGHNSIWNILFPGDKPPIPRGVVHGDEMIYLFSTKVFNLSEDDWNFSWKMVSLWTNFAIYGNPTPDESPIEDVPSWPTFNEIDMPYLVIDKKPSVERNYVNTWTSPDRRN